MKTVRWSSHKTNPAPEEIQARSFIFARHVTNFYSTSLYLLNVTTTAHPTINNILNNTLVSVFWKTRYNYGDEVSFRGKTGMVYRFV